MFSTDGICIACGLYSDAKGNHGISCGSQGEQIARHNHLRDAVFATTASANLSPTREEKALLPNFNGGPADVMLRDFMQHSTYPALTPCRLKPWRGLLRS